MSALDTAKELRRMVATATLSKDVIDLFEKKVALLTEQVTTLETENMDLKKKKVENLQQKLTRLRPTEGKLEGGAEDILNLLFHSEELSMSAEDMGDSLGMKKGVAQYHCYVLYEAEMVGFSGIGVFHLSPKGRAYCCEMPFEIVAGAEHPRTRA
jgi:hypothetical protein